MSERTIFEDILKGRVSVDKVLEGEDFLAFRDINPQAPVHVLVIPRQKIKSFHELSDLEPKEILAFMNGIQKTAAHLGLEAGGYRIVFNTGDDGGQTVNYIHAHILGGRRMTWPPG